MDQECLKQLEKEVKKTKRIASEAAMELHDLIEDRLPDAYLELMAIAENTFKACQAWDQATQKLLAATSETA